MKEIEETVDLWLNQLMTPRAEVNDMLGTIVACGARLEFKLWAAFWICFSFFNLDNR